MNRLERCLAGICIVAFPLVDTFSQSAVVTAGGNATGPNGSVAYSIGQYDYDHYSGSTGSINLGVQQPDFVIIIGTEELNGLIDIRLYPNPVSDGTNLHMEEEVFSTLHQNLRYELYDLAGKLLAGDKIHASKTIVRTTMLHNGEYILRVLNEKQDLKTFKIVKSN